MPRVAPLRREDLGEFEDVFSAIEQAMGFVPNSQLTLARVPRIMQAFGGLARAVLWEGSTSRELKQLVAFVASNAAGCRYCQAHTAHGAEHAGVPRAKIDAAFEFETSELFSDAERAALRVARDAALVPNETTDDDFVQLQRHFSDEEIVEIVAVIALFGWLNRWNDTMATELEGGPRAFAEQALGPHEWSVGKHARAG